MKRFIALGRIGGLIVASLILAKALSAQSGLPMAPSEAQEDSGPKLGEFIGAIAENESRQATDYQQIAQMTLQLGQAGMQQGQRLPDASVWDAIYCVEAGKSMSPFATDWDTLRSELEKLLEEPPEDQQQQDDQNSDEQNQEEQENSENQDSENQDGEQSGDQQSEDQSEESNSDQENSENQEGQNGDQEDPSQNPQDGQDSQDQRPQPNQNLGDMDTPEQTPELDQQRDPPQEEQTQVGGEQNQQPIRSAKQAMTLQQLEQIKQQDKPGALHMLLQQAEQGDNPTPPQTLQKDW